MASVTLNLSVWETKYSTSANTSDIGYSLSVTSVNAVNGNNWQCPYEIRLGGPNGTLINSGYKGFGNNTTTQLASGTITNYAHNPDGSGSITLYAHYYTDVEDWQVTPKEASTYTTIKLTTIKRATEVPSLSMYIKSSYNIPLSPYVNSFTHSIRFHFGNINKWLQNDGTLGDTEVKFSTKSPLFTVPKEYYQQFTGPSGVGTVYITTYNGNTSVGTKNKQFTIQCNPALCTPVASATVVDVNEKTLALTKNENNIVRYGSHMLITPTIQITDPDDTNATITSKAVVSGNSTVSFTSDTVTIVGPNDKYVNLVITNSRNMTSNTTVSAQGDLVEYVPLTLDVNKVYRKEPTTGEVIIEYSGNYFAGEFTSEKITSQYIQVGDNLVTETFKMNFPEDAYKYINEEEIIIITTTEHDIIANYDIGRFGSGEGITYYIRIRDNTGETTNDLIVYCVYVNGDTVEIIENLTEMPTPSMQVGVVESINSNTELYKYFTRTEIVEPIPNELEISWWYKTKTEEDYILGGTLNPTINVNKNTYEGNETLGGFTTNDNGDTTLNINFDYKQQYDFIFTAVDKISDGDTEERSISRGYPIFWWDENDVHFLGNVYVGDRSILGSNVIYDVTLTEATSVIEATDLDMKGDGGEYEFVFINSGSSSSDVHITVNNLEQGYYQSAFGYTGNNSETDSSSTPSLNVINAYRSNRNWIYWGTDCSPSQRFPSTLSGKFFFQNNNTLAYSLKNECSVSGYQVLAFITGVNDQSITNVTSLKIEKSTGTFNPYTRLIIKKVV